MSRSSTTSRGKIKAHPVSGRRPVHPGEILREDYLVPLGLSVNALSVALGVPAARIHEIVKERRSVTADTAAKLAKHSGKVGVGPLLVFDALLHVLVVRVELAEGVVGAIALVVVGQDGFKRGFLAFRVVLVVLLFLRLVVLDLLHIRIAFGGR